MKTAKFGAQLPVDADLMLTLVALALPGPSVFDLSVSGRPGPSEVAGGRGKTKTENRKQKGGPGARHEKPKTYPLGP